MKLLIQLTLFFTCCASEVPVLAQDTLYYNAIWKETTADKASYFRIKARSTVGWQVTDYFLLGKPQMKGEYADDSFHVRQGEFAWYDSSGVINHRCVYVNNKQNGPETFYYASGQVKISGNNKKDEAEGEWAGYYPSGKVSGNAKFKKGKQISGAFYHEDGSPDKNVTEFWRDSEFPGGIPQWLRFLNKTFRYPDSAVVYEIQGTVVIGFMVSKDGKVHDLRVAQSVNKYLDEEALRVMRQTPDWQPAIVGGIISESYNLQPIVFKLQSE